MNLINRTLLATYLNQLRDYGDLDRIHIFLTDIGLEEEQINKYIKKYIERDNFGACIMNCITCNHNYFVKYRENLKMIQKKFTLIYNR